MDIFYLFLIYGNLSYHLWKHLKQVQKNDNFGF